MKGCYRERERAILHPAATGIPHFCDAPELTTTLIELKLNREAFPLTERDVLVFVSEIFVVGLQPKKVRSRASAQKGS
jgi:hypothetical protein